MTAFVWTQRSLEDQCLALGLYGFAFVGVFACPLCVLVCTRFWNGASRALGYAARLAGCAANYSECGLRRFVFVGTGHLRLESF